MATKQPIVLSHSLRDGKSKIKVVLGLVRIGLSSSQMKSLPSLVKGVDKLPWIILKLLLLFIIIIYLFIFAKPLLIILVQANKDYLVNE